MKEPWWGLAVAMQSVGYGKCIGVGPVVQSCIPKKYATKKPRKTSHATIVARATIVACEVFRGFCG